jgi:hypothetical protein
MTLKKMILKTTIQQATIFSLPLSRFSFTELPITAAAMPRTQTEYCR